MTLHASIECPSDQGQRGIVPISCSRAHVVDWREWREVLQRNHCPEAIAGRHSRQSFFETQESLCGSEHDPTAIRASATLPLSSFFITALPWRSKSPGSAGRRVSGSTMHRPRCTRHDDVRQNFIRTAKGLAVSYDEVGQGNATRTLGETSSISAGRAAEEVPRQRRVTHCRDCPQQCRDSVSGSPRFRGLRS